MPSVDSTELQEKIQKENITPMEIEPCMLLFELIPYLLEVWEL